MIIAVDLVGMVDRQLRMDNPNRFGFDWARKSAIPEFPQVFEVPREDLLSQGRLLAVQASEEVFARFRWTPGRQFLTTMQSELFKR
jgi:hypothetical protein